MLDESKRHASYLAISEQIGEIDLSLSFIELHEGLYNEALISQMRSHKLIRSPYLWEESILKTFELLVLLGKWNDAQSFLEKLISTYKECLKSKDFEDTHMKLGWCISTASLCKTELILRNLLTKFDKNQFKDMTTQLKMFVSMANKYGVNLNHSLQVSKLMTICEKEISKRPVGDETEFKNSYRFVNTFIKMGHKMDSLAKENLKYIFAPGLESKIRSPLVTFHNRTKLALARLYIVFGDLAMKAQHMRISINKVDAVEAEEDGLDNEEETDRQLDLYKNLPPAHVAYLTKLNREIEKLGQKSKKRLDSFERASSLAKEVENTSFLPEDTVFAKIEYFRGLRRRNAKIGNLRGAEHRETEPSNQGYDEVPHAEREKYSRDLLTSMKEIKELTLTLSDDKSKESAENGIFDYCRNDDIFRTLKRVYYEELEIWTGGFGDPEETLSALMKFQDYQTFDYLSSVVKTHCRKTSRVHLLKCLLQEQYHLYNYLDKPLLDDLRQNHRYYSITLDW